ncbi:hypothetical protein IPM62_05055 [Candidatus Woesebacteria bacterium]|nr:MAG: hypothetical protein IPM62_05055 [Candidatus Woesebacteria bacterium]
MTNWQFVLIYIFAFVAFVFFVRGYYECKYRKNTHGTFLPINIIGAFVWADAVVFGIFWVIGAVISLVLQDWILFLLIYCVFWGVRGLGETLYWLNQQYSDKVRNPVERFPRLLKIFHNDSIWFVYQIYWQCIMVISIIASIYLGNKWLNRL